MLQFDDLKALFNKTQNNKNNVILPIITTLISGLIIILSISPQYLLELNPFTLFLLSVASALPVWAINQLLWLHLERRASDLIVGRFVLIFDVPDKEKKILSFVLSRLIKTIDVMRFIPSKDIANLVTIVTIYLCAAFAYLTPQSPANLYLSIMCLSLAVWLVSLGVLQWYCRKIDIRPLKNSWEQLVGNKELLEQVKKYFEIIKEHITARTGEEPQENEGEETPENPQSTK